jgi:hypothetical protein
MFAGLAFFSFRTHSNSINVNTIGCRIAFDFVNCSRIVMSPFSRRMKVLRTKVTITGCLNDWRLDFLIAQNYFCMKIVNFFIELINLDSKIIYAVLFNKLNIQYDLAFEQKLRGKTAYFCISS